MKLKEILSRLKPSVPSKRRVVYTIGLTAILSINILAGIWIGYQHGVADSEPAKTTCANLSPGQCVWVVQYAADLENENAQLNRIKRDLTQDLRDCYNEL